MIAFLFTILSVVGGERPPLEVQSTGNQLAATCFKSGEQDAGMNKICYYDCLGSTVAITIRSTQLCPLSIKN